MEKTLTSTYRNRILVKQAQLAVLTSKYNKAMAAGAAEIDRLARECMARQAMMKRAFVAVKGLSKSAQTTSSATHPQNPLAGTGGGRNGFIYGR